MSSVRILIVDDHRLVCEAVALLIERQGDMQIVGAATTADEALAAARRLRPDVTIMDLMLPTVDGLEATRRILEALPQTRIIALSACHTIEQVQRALRAGARGYVLKSAASEDLLSAITTVIGGQQYLSPAIAEMLAGGAPNVLSRRSPFENLSSRERAVLRGILSGSTSADIAHTLSLSHKTVDTYRSRIMLKLGVPNRAALIRLATAYELPPV